LHRDGGLGIRVGLIHQLLFDQCRHRYTSHAEDAPSGNAPANPCSLRLEA
jgi:hypothetical protein